MPMCPKLRIRKSLLIVGHLGLVLCRARSWTGQSLWVFSNSIDSLILFSSPQTSGASSRSLKKLGENLKGVQGSLQFVKFLVGKCDVTLSRITVLMYLWTWARERKAVRQPLVRNFSLLSSRFLQGQMGQILPGMGGAE